MSFGIKSSNLGENNANCDKRSSDQKELGEFMSTRRIEKELTYRRPLHSMSQALTSTS